MDGDIEPPSLALRVFHAKPVRLAGFIIKALENRMIAAEIETLLSLSHHNIPLFK